MTKFKEFKDSGLFAFVNMILHTFGWVLIMEGNSNGEVVGFYPARTKHRGIPEKEMINMYKKISLFMDNNSSKLFEEAYDLEEFDYEAFNINDANLHYDEKSRLCYNSIKFSFIGDIIRSVVGLLKTTDEDIHFEFNGEVFKMSPYQSLSFKEDKEYSLEDIKHLFVGKIKK